MPDPTANSNTVSPQANPVTAELNAVNDAQSMSSDKRGNRILIIAIVIVVILIVGSSVVLFLTPQGRAFMGLDSVSSSTTSTSSSSSAVSVDQSLNDALTQLDSATSTSSIGSLDPALDFNVQ